MEQRNKAANLADEAANNFDESGTDRTKRNRRTKKPPQRFPEPAAEEEEQPSPPPQSPGFYIESVYIKNPPEVKKEPVDVLPILLPTAPSTSAAVTFSVDGTNVPAPADLAEVGKAVPKRVPTIKLLKPSNVIEGLKIIGGEEFRTLTLFSKLDRSEALECVLIVAGKVVSLLAVTQRPLRRSFGNPFSLVRRIQERRCASQVLRAIAPHALTESIAIVVPKMLSAIEYDASDNNASFTWEAFFDGYISCEATVIDEYLVQIRQNLIEVRAAAPKAALARAEVTTDSLANNKLTFTPNSDSFNSTRKLDLQVMTMREVVHINGSGHTGVPVSTDTTKFLLPPSAPGSTSSAAAFPVSLNVPPPTNIAASLSPSSRSSCVSDVSIATLADGQADEPAADSSAAEQTSLSGLIEKRNERSHACDVNVQADFRLTSVDGAALVQLPTSAFKIPEPSLVRISRAAIPRLPLVKRVGILSCACKFLSNFSLNPPASPLSLSFPLLSEKMPQFSADDIRDVLEIAVTDFDISRWKLHTRAYDKKLVCMALLETDSVKGLVQRQRIIQNLKRTPRATPTNSANSSPPMEPQTNFPFEPVSTSVPVSPTSVTHALLEESRKRSIDAVNNDADVAVGDNVDAEQRKKLDSLRNGNIDTVTGPIINSNMISDEAPSMNVSASDPVRPASPPAFTREQDQELFENIMKYESKLVGKGNVLTDYHLKGAAESIAKQQDMGLEKAIEWITKIVRGFIPIRTTIELSFDLVHVRRFQDGEASSASSRFLGEIVRSHQRNALKVLGFQMVQSALRPFHVDKSYLAKVQTVYSRIDSDLLAKATTVTVNSGIASSSSAKKRQPKVANKTTSSRSSFGRKRSVSGVPARLDVPVGLRSIGGSPNKRTARSLYAADEMPPISSTNVAVDDEVFGKVSKLGNGAVRSVNQKLSTSSCPGQHPVSNTSPMKRKLNLTNASLPSAVKSAAPGSNWVAHLPVPDADGRSLLPPAPKLNEPPVFYVTAQLSNCCLTIQENAAFF